MTNYCEEVRGDLQVKKCREPDLVLLPVAWWEENSELGWTALTLLQGEVEVSRGGEGGRPHQLLQGGLD